MCYIVQPIFKFVYVAVLMFAFGIASKRMNLCIDPVEIMSSYFIISSYSPMFICSQTWQVCKQKSIPLFCSQDNLSFSLMSDMKDQMNIKYPKTSAH